VLSSGPPTSASAWRTSRSSGTISLRHETGWNKASRATFGACRNHHRADWLSTQASRLPRAISRALSPCSMTRRGSTSAISSRMPGRSRPCARALTSRCAIGPPLSVGTAIAASGRRSTRTMFANMSRSPSPGSFWRKEKTRRGCHVSTICSTPRRPMADCVPLSR